MIKNERQYRITRSQLDRFRGVLDQLEARSVDEGQELRRELETAAVRAQISELAAEIDEYDNLKAGKAEVGDLESLGHLPRVLIRARIASGLTQRDLADRLDMPEQQVQRYEANDWGTASLGRLIDVARVLGIATKKFVAEPDNQQVDARQLRRQLEHAGLDRTFIEHRLVPQVVEDTPARGAVLDLAARVNRIYRWAPSDVLAGEHLEVEMPVAVGFKLPKGANEPRLRAYTVYAHYIADLALQATTGLPTKRIPTPANVFRAAVLARSSSVDFESILGYLWELGIPVVPLADPGAFHAVVWRMAGRNVVVLKQQVRSPFRWAFDVLHETEHASESPDATEYAVVDDDTSSTDDTELAANAFAGDVLLDGRAEALANECVNESEGRLEYLKTVVPRVARRNKVQTADLANYLAYRLSLQGENWWGAATNLQQGGTDPWATTRDLFLKHADLRALNPLDRDLLTQALTPQETR